MSVSRSSSPNFGSGSSGFWIFHEQRMGPTSSPSQHGPASLASSSWNPSLRSCSSSSLILQRARLVARLRLRACAEAANDPACADRIAVRPSPRMATATITSSSVKPESWRGRVTSELRVGTLRLLLIGSWPRHRHLARLELALACQRRDEHRDEVAVVVVLAVPPRQDDRGSLGLSAGPEVEVGPLGDLGLLRV